MKPKVFVGSSVEGLTIAYAIQEEFEHDADVIIWHQGVFDLNRSTFDTLYNKRESFDFAIFVITPDDPIMIRGEDYYVGRDNILFELGLFISALGSSRCFYIYPRNIKNLHLPTDLLGITAPTYDPEKIKSDSDIRSAIGAACNKIRMIIRKEGILSKRHAAIFYDKYQYAPKFQELLAMAETEMFSFGPSLLYVAENLKDLAFHRAKEGIKIRLMMMANDLVATKYVNDYASGSDFNLERDLAQKVLSVWQKDANDQGLDISIRTTSGILPLSVSIVDPQLDSGKMLVIPLPYQTPGPDRPCFYLLKAGNPKSINHYVQKFNLLWESSKNILDS